MGNTCLLPLLTPRVPETVVRRVKSASRIYCKDFFLFCFAQFSSSSPASPQDVHSPIVVSSCGFGRFGCRVEETLLHKHQRASSKVFL
jgi:hypothetical protein